MHIAVTPENHVSVHVDRVSPLDIRPGRPSRYSPLRVLRHNMAHGVDCWNRLWRHSADHRCELDCEIVIVEDEQRGDAPVLYQFSCRAAGAQGCRWKAQATSEEALLAKVTEHARAVHGVSRVSNTLANYIQSVAAPR